MTTTLVNSSKLCVWIYSQSELRLVLKTKSNLFNQLNRLLKQYPAGTVQQPQDEPQFKLPAKPTKSFVDEMVGILGAHLTRSIWPPSVGPSKVSQAPKAPSKSAIDSLA